MSETHIFKLVSGPECEIRHVIGEDQDIFSSKKNVANGSNASKFMASIVLRIGSKTNITESDIDALLTVDRKKIFLEIHRFESDFEPKYRFTHTYVHENKTYEYEVEVDMDEIAHKPCHYYENGQFIEISCSEYDEVIPYKKQKFILPSSKKEVSIQMVDGNFEKRARQMESSKAVYSSDIALRNPEYEIENGLWARLDLKKLRGTDITALRNFIEKCEGEIDTRVVFENPKDQGKMITFDLMGVKDFLFPAAPC